MGLINRPTKKLTLCALVAILAVLLAYGDKANISAQSAPKRDSRYYVVQAQQAYKDKNYSSYLENLRSAFALRPNHPTLMYNLAGAYALVGQDQESLTLLTRIAEMGLVYPAEKDEDFASIKNSSLFEKILQTFKRNATPMGQSRIAFTLHEKGLVPESVAYDPVGRMFYVGSVYRRKILAIDGSGAVKEFASERDGLWSVFGMKVDATRRVLWICTGAHSQMSGFQKSEDGNAAILKYDLTSGKLLKKYLLPNKGSKHSLGDLALNRRGDVFTTDSLSPAVYVIDHRKDELELFAAGEPFVSPQGLDFSADHQSLYVADYSRGLFVINVKSRKISQIAAVTDTALLGIDGLYRHKNSLLAIQNGTNPARVIRLILDRPGRRILKWQTVEANNDKFDEPTLGVLVKNNLYYVANSQWGSVNQRGELAPDDKLKEPVILKVRL